MNKFIYLVAYYISSILIKIKRNSYQSKRNPDSNLNLIVPFINKKDSILDLGCDQGFYAIFFAKKGHYVTAVDIKKNLIRNIDFYRRAHKLNLLNVLCEKIDLDFIDKLPSFDSIFYLSLHHYFYRENGEEYSRKILLSLLLKTTKKLFIQVSTKNSKYKSNINLPDDPVSLKHYIQNICGNKYRVEFIGSNTESMKELSRHLYVVHK